MKRLCGVMRMDWHQAADQDFQEAVDVDVVEAVVEHAEHALALGDHERRRAARVQVLRDGAALRRGRETRGDERVDRDDDEHVDAGERFIEGIVGRAPTPEECPRGAIVGVVRLVGVLREGGKCTRPGDARWYMGAVGWLLDDPIALEEPILHTGSLGLRFLAPRIERLVLDSPELRSA